MTRHLALGLAIVCVVASPAAAQRTPDGHPDFQGNWTNGTATPLERPEEFKDKAVFTREEAAAFERGGRDRLLAIIPEDQLKVAGDLDPVYLETQDYRVVDDRRTSLIVDPPNGKLPPPIEEAAARTTMPPAPNYDGPEGLGLDERCLVSIGFAWSAAAPPMVANPFSENYYQIVQTPDYLMILAEGVHDARIIRIGGRHLPASMHQWLGDSVGRWEGDTLVVDTTNYSPKGSFHGSSARLHVVERFTRVDQNTIGYRATIDDPGTWTAPWTVDIPLKATSEPVLEYACHEANYSLEFSLRGERSAEARAAAGR
jgi:hypothetical protein